MIQVQGIGWSHRQIRAFQKASDMSPYIASSAKQSHDTHHAIRVWVPAFRCWQHTSTIRQSVKILGKAKGMPANNGHHSTRWLKCHLQAIAVCDVMWTATWRQSHATELIFHRKMRSIHKAGQQNLWRSHSSNPKANQSQNASHSIVAGAHRRQWGHILDDQQKRNSNGRVRNNLVHIIRRWIEEKQHMAYYSIWLNISIC